MTTLTIDDEGETVVHDLFVVSAPISGRLMRIDLEPGDAVERRKTILARILPTEPGLLDTRTRTEALAREKMYTTSGHLPYYAESMFPPMELREEGPAHARVSEALVESSQGDETLKKQTKELMTWFEDWAKAQGKTAKDANFSEFIETLPGE